ncbi:Zn-dependent alcohol dehydrogenase [Mycolicibacterium smegmatis]|uniref:Alcohol dehydrogenase n=2 Tax=Mycolicibacterium smegmatis (strain ATCC 700084 / mc(2)155) TaxID=246196 RepID=I7G4V7_MYCS2|nr:Zn-dependent alcohol dehydrogenase [Mycolicibacterium smegmatis]ABK75278.1 alcohol dehydrogenase 1 [Mycolicibacterium smegmatis MC2 155]AFP37584.1 Alcohol dehydrogenase [Mycolicibacterium smegmatis MC2 155]MCC3334514.1 Zn-dependent alcohol dehydrogenase [Mycolicibacterium smegmatis]MCO4194213.1 Zn-dependent alcohol dehydrogenase [Mycolicibacterium smegmatis]TBH45912.1 Zn-dependent alcohol dehydrogenase [Mycolicibacterium smegmatis MC2 155]
MPAPDTIRPHSTSIRAAVFDGTISVEPVDLADPRPGEVRVKIAAAGVCHSDLHVTTGAWDVPAPVVLGHEGSGVVTAVGEGVDDLEPGDHVVLSWVPGCGECRYCKAGRPAQCSLVASVVAVKGTLYDGTTRLSNERGTVHHYLGVSSYAEQVVVPRNGAIKVRKDAPLEDIAIVGCAIATGVGAVRNTAGVEPGSTVAVIGCGGVGLACVQGARLAGASRIVAVDVVAEKLELARKLGATDAVDASATDDVVAAMREVLPDGYDYVFDAIGKIATTEQAIAALGLGGAAVIVGLPPQGERASFDPLTLAEADQRILGSNYGSAVPERDIPALVDEVMAGNLDLASMISGRRPLEEAAAALDDLAAGHALRQLLIPSA